MDLRGGEAVDLSEARGQQHIIYMFEENLMAAVGTGAGIVGIGQGKGEGEGKNGGSTSGDQMLPHSTKYATMRPSLEEGKVKEEGKRKEEEDDDL